jgi:archaellum component FlaG (FlaF/FlaG flagellin family)
MSKASLRNIPLLSVIIISVLGSIVVSGVLSTSLTLSSSGSIKAINVDVYWDSACTNPVGSINWGNSDLGTTVTRSFYIKNSGNSALTLTMNTNNWDPVEAQSHLSLTWNREGYVLDPDGVVRATLSLNIPLSAEGIMDYSFDIIIEGTG